MTSIQAKLDECQPGERVPRWVWKNDCPPEVKLVILLPPKTKTKWLISTKRAPLQPPTKPAKNPSPPSPEAPKHAEATELRKGKKEAAVAPPNLLRCGSFRLFLGVGTL